MTELKAENEAYSTVEFSADEIDRAEDFADAHARVDAQTKDPEGVIANKAASRLSEVAAVVVLDKMGYSPDWKDEDVTAGDEAPYDIELTEYGSERIDVKCRRSADDGKTANLMPSRDVRERAGRTHDAYIMVWVAPDLSEARVYGAATVEYFQSEASVFYGVQPPAERLRRDDLQPLAVLGDRDIAPLAYGDVEHEIRAAESQD